MYSCRRSVELIFLYHATLLWWRRGGRRGGQWRRWPKKICAHIWVSEEIPARISVVIGCLFIAAKWFKMWYTTIGTAINVSLGVKGKTPNLHTAYVGWRCATPGIHICFRHIICCVRICTPRNVKSAGPVDILNREWLVIICGWVGAPRMTEDWVGNGASFYVIHK